LVATKQKELKEGRTTDKDIYIPTDNGTSILAYNMVKIEPPISGDDDWPFIGLTILDKGEDGMVVG
jgi:hypothetical protein